MDLRVDRDHDEIEGSVNDQSDLLKGIDIYRVIEGETASIYCTC